MSPSLGVLVVLYDHVVKLTLEPPHRHDSAISITNMPCEIYVISGELPLSLLSEYPCAVACVEANNVLELLATILPVFKHLGTRGASVLEPRSNTRASTTCCSVMLDCSVARTCSNNCSAALFLTT